MTRQRTRRVYLLSGSGALPWLGGAEGGPLEGKELAVRYCCLVDRLARQTVVVALLAGALVAWQVRSSWPQARVPGALYLDSEPQGAQVELPGATSLHGFHLKVLGRTPGPLPLDLGERTTFSFRLSLAGYHPETVHLTAEALRRGPSPVRMRPRWPGLSPLLYGLRVYARLVGAGALLLGFWLGWVRPERLRRQRVAALLERAELSPGAELMGYRVDGELGRGGMSRVYRVHPVSGGEGLAMKVLRVDWASDPKARERFHREVALWRNLSHPHIVHLMDWGEAEGYVVLVTEWIDGQTLAERSTPPGWSELRRWAEELASALDYAHAQGVVHRDVKPANLMLDQRQRLWLLDFGVAGQLGEQGVAEGHAGTLGFMAPEQLQGRASPASDYYSLGCTLYALACGSPPFAGVEPLALLARQAQRQYPPLREARPDCSPAWDRLIDRLLDPDPAQRPVGRDEIQALLNCHNA